MGADAFAHQYLVSKLAEVDDALDRLDASPDALEQHETRRQLVELRARFVVTLSILAGEPEILH